MKYTYGSVYPFTVTYRHGDGSIATSVVDPVVHLIASDATTLDLTPTLIETGVYSLDWTIPATWPLGTTRFCYQGTYDSGTWVSDEETFTVVAPWASSGPPETPASDLIAAYAQQSVTVTRRAGTFDVYGQPAVEAPVDLAARFQQVSKMVRNPKGEQMMSDALVFLAGGTRVAPGDQVTYNSATYEVLSVRRGQGLDAETHVVAYLGGR